MAKIYGLFGTMTGKLAETVMVVRNGEQIARKYQPVVSNPSSPAQIAQRAKLKMISQLSAIMAPVIAMPRQGSITSRNIFTKRNIGNATYVDNTASIPLEGIKLTSSVVALPGLTVTVDTNNDVTMRLGGAIDNVDRVVYSIFAIQGDDEMRLEGSVVVNKGSNSSVFEGTYSSQHVGRHLVLAYGIRDNNDAARAIFGDMTVPSAQQIAKLVVTRTLRESDITLTETQGFLYVPGNN